MDKKGEEKKAGFLLVRLGGLGDLLVTVPSIQLIKKSRPQTKLTLVARFSYGYLLKEAGLVETLLSLEDSQASFLFQEKVEKSLLDISYYDLIIVWANKDIPSWRQMVKKKFGERIKVIIANSESKISLAQYFLFKTAELLKIEIGKDEGMEKLGLLSIKEVWKKEAEIKYPWIRGYPFVVIHPGSGGLSKRWKLNNFLRLVDFFDEKKKGGVFITGPAEEDYFPKLSTYRWPPQWGWAHEPPLSLICGLLSQAELYIGNDSGITHLAALCGCRGLAFFREENCPLWSPWTKKIKIMAAPEPDQIEFPLVCQEIEALLKVNLVTPFKGGNNS